MYAIRSYYVLLGDLLMGTGDHPFRSGQRLLLRFNPAAHVEPGLDILGTEATGQQTAAFDPAQGVTGVDKWDAKLIGKARAYIAGIGISYNFV